MYKRRDLKCPVAPDFTSTGIIRGVGIRRRISEEVVIGRILGMYIMNYKEGHVIILGKSCLKKTGLIILKLGYCQIMMLHW